MQESFRKIAEAWKSAIASFQNVDTSGFQKAAVALSGIEKARVWSDAFNRQIEILGYEPCMKEMGIVWDSMSRLLKPARETDVQTEFLNIAHSLNPEVATSFYLATKEVYPEFFIKKVK